MRPCVSSSIYEHFGVIIAARDDETINRQCIMAYIFRRVRGRTLDARWQPYAA